MASPFGPTSSGRPFSSILMVRPSGMRTSRCLPSGPVSRRAPLDPSALTAGRSMRRSSGRTPSIKIRNAATTSPPISAMRIQSSRSRAMNGSSTSARGSGMASRRLTIDSVSPRASSIPTALRTSVSSSSSSSDRQGLEHLLAGIVGAVGAVDLHRHRQPLEPAGMPGLVAHRARDLVVDGLLVARALLA